MQPIQRIDNIATTTNRFVSGAQRSVGTTVAKMTMSPPMVGVPRLL